MPTTASAPATPFPPLATPAVAPAAVPGPVTHRRRVLAALVMASFMSSIEATIVATAMPSIAAKIGGFGLYAWVFSAYLLMQATVTPVFGKLADVFGRKPTFLAGLSIFIAGSVLCGFASSMEMLVVFRLVQGIGAGAVQPLTMILVGDLYSLEERARVQGVLGAVWGTSAIVGPLAGGLIVAHVDWHWVFWLNVPFGLVSAAMAWRYLHERVERHAVQIDAVGAGLLFVGVAALMLALTQATAWGAAVAGGLAAAALAVLAAFVWQERRAPDPVVHLDLWRTPLVRVANTATFLSGLVMIGLISLLPTYMQGVLGASPLAAGFSLTGMMLGWPVASFLGGRMLVTAGARQTSRTGGAILVVGTLAVALGAPHGPVWAGLGTFLVGLGLGFGSTAFLVSIQTVVGWRQRGAATASNLLMRLLGSTVGAALFGGILNARLGGVLAARGVAGEVSIERLRDLLGEGGATGAGGALSPAAASALHDGLALGLETVFWTLVAAAAALALVAWRLPDLPANAPAPAPGAADVAL